MSKIDEIYEAILPEMAAHDLEDTTEHRLWFLEGLRDGWREDDSDACIEKGLYVMTVTLEMMSLRIQLALENWRMNHA